MASNMSVHGQFAWRYVPTKILLHHEISKQKFHAKNVEDEAIHEALRGFLFTTFEGLFLKNVLWNHSIDIYCPLNRSFFWSFFDSFR
jgi:hypothetical protein